jgi:hypothetical protein
MIPVQIPYKIRPEINDPIRYSVIYTFTSNDMVEYDHGYMLYRIPHAPCTYWTNFRFNQKTRIELIMITTEGTAHSLTTQSQPDEWHTTLWPLPSIDTIDQSGYYMKIHHGYEPGNTKCAEVMITMVGFIDLFSLSPVYQLVSTDQACQFIIIKEDPTSYEKNIIERGSIHHMTLEQKEVKREDGIIIRLIADYR